jgi:hypothetical protein
MYNDLKGLMVPKTLIFLLLCIGFLLPASPSALHTLKLGRDGLIPVSIPAGNALVLPILKADLDGNGIQETLQLENTHLSIKTNGVTVWKSPQGWHVDQAEMSGLDRNGNLEVTLLVWRPVSIPRAILSPSRKVSVSQPSFTLSSRILLGGSPLALSTHTTNSPFLHLVA